MRAHCDLCVLIVGARRVCLFREMGKWDLGGMGNGLLNGLIGGNGRLGETGV